MPARGVGGLAKTHRPQPESIVIDGKQHWQDLPTDIQLWMGVASFGDVDIALDRRTMQIRPYQSSDELAVIALWRECGLTRPWNDPGKDIARKLAVQPELFLVGAKDGQVVASVMAGYEGHRGWVNYLAVSPVHRGYGYGKKLMQHIEQLLLDRGCPKINLLVRATNAGMIEFYRNIGFVQDEAVSLGKRLIPDEPAV